MLNIKSIFNNSLFRIPDYQRGYSWEKKNLDDFWQDLNNLQERKVHYTGMISVEVVDEDEFSKWKEDLWLLTGPGGRGDTPYFIVDGQQRLSTIIILIWVISQKMDENAQLSFNTKEQIISKYIFTENQPTGQKSYIFGYHKDNPSYEFLKREIFEQEASPNGEPLEETLYTNNLLFAKKYFQDKLKKATHLELQVLFDKITQHLKFDFKKLEKELDIFIVFETMNNRGKALSNLEKLKNRLIYISTLLPNETQQRRIELREKINEKWKVIYKYLGLNKEHRLDDDLFLQNHWIMFKRYDRREPEFYANDIFDRYYTSQNVLKSSETFDTISKYIESIAESSKQWFVMNSPSHYHAADIAESPKVINWLKKINRLGFKSFAPLIMGALVSEKDHDKKANLLKAIEGYIFLIFDVSFRRSNTGTYHFNARANELYKNEITTESVIEDIYFWIYGKNEYKGYFDPNSFYSFLKDVFVRANTNGYYDWKYLRYFLYEFELSLPRVEGSKRTWTELNTVLHVYPNGPTQACWKIPFKSYNSQQRKYLSGSLGNFVLGSKGTDVDECFEERKLKLRLNSNSIEIIEKSSWGREEILERGLKMLSFMEKRWKIQLGSDEEKIKLLFMDAF